MAPQTPDLKTPVYCEIQRDLPGDERLDQHFVNSFGKGLNVTNVHLYVNVPHSSFKANWPLNYPHNKCLQGEIVDCCYHVPPLSMMAGFSPRLQVWLFRTVINSRPFEGGWEGMPYAKISSLTVLCIDKSMTLSVVLKNCNYTFFSQSLPSVSFHLDL